ncbi:MAG: hypothetical protein JJU21_15075 [Salinarimonas sp.]|nr:hypothetical protein [Salinarimonas sp.]
MIADSTPDSGPQVKRHSIAIDESAISPNGWMTLDLSVTRGVPVPVQEQVGISSSEPAQGRSPAADESDAILSLGPREMAAAAMLRAVQAQPGEQTRADAGQSDADANADATRRAWRLAREARALARARGQLPQRRSCASPTARQPAVIPADAIIPVGGSDLRAYTPAQPFPRDDKAANDNRGRMLLMTALLVGISAGYAMTAKNPPTREGYEVPAPLTRDIRVSQMPETPNALPPGTEVFDPL